MLRILTLSNKPNYLKEAIASVQAQTRQDFVHIVEMDTYRAWGDLYPPAVFYNEQTKAAAMEDCVAWLSDDDLLLPHYVEVLLGFLEEHPEVQCVYGGSKHVLCYPGREPKLIRYLPEGSTYPIFNERYTPGFKIDGGQFVVRRSALEEVPYPYYSEGIEAARACDAHYMDKLVRYFPMHPVQTVVMWNRVTTQSSHAIATPEGNYLPVDWRRRK